jgi:hypothetical protein
MISVRHMCERESHNADIPVQPPGGVPQVLRQDDPDGRDAAHVAAALCHLQVKNPSPQAGCHWRHLTAHLCVAVLHGGGQQVGSACFSIPLLHVFRSFFALW